uniref:Uncharacterized protein n=1 Tax=Trichuris muris TaxID=70415 RepID=A0A5S6QXF4_TRIMR
MGTTTKAKPVWRTAPHPKRAPTSEGRTLLAPIQRSRRKSEGGAFDACRNEVTEPTGDDHTRTLARHFLALAVGIRTFCYANVTDDRANRLSFPATSRRGATFVPLAGRHKWAPNAPLLRTATGIANARPIGAPFLSSSFGGTGESTSPCLINTSAAPLEFLPFALPLGRLPKRRQLPSLLGRPALLWHPPRTTATAVVLVVVDRKQAEIHSSKS